MNAIASWFGRSRKAIGAWVGANLTWCTVIATQPQGFHSITAVEWVGLAIANATALHVYNVTNDPASSDQSAKTPAPSISPAGNPVP